jgi:hypothetical protein
MEVRQKARTTTVGNDAYTGPSGQITADTDRNELRLHDGSTAGGHRILNKSQNDLLYHAIGTLTIGDVTGLQTALDGKAGLSHTHDIADVTGLQTALDGKLGLTAKAADSDKLDNLNSSQFLRSDTNDTMSGYLDVTNYVRARTHMNIGYNGGGDSYIYYYDDNSNTDRHYGWDDSANAFVGEENDNGVHYLSFVDTQSSAGATNFPRGHMVIASYNGSNHANRNTSRGLYIYTGNSQQYVDSTGSNRGTQLSGTWRASGVSGSSTQLWRRVA